MNAETPQNMRVNNHLQAQQPQPQQPSSSASASSSPAHEFSFLVSLPQSSSNSSTAFAAPLQPKATELVDLSPADDIFFHGHLLPLHLLSNLPSSNISPRSSTNSLESFTLPIRELLEDPSNKNNSNTSINSEIRSEETPKSKNSFSLLKWRKDNKEETDSSQKQRPQKKRKKLRFDVSHVLKRYIRMIRPIFISLRRRTSENGLQLRGGGQSYSFSGSLTPRGSGSGGGRRGLFSAPASMRTSPTNSGLLVGTGPGRSASSTSDSTMEELQAAIQAAIAHCKNSIAMDDNGLSNKTIKC